MDISEDSENSSLLLFNSSGHIKVGIYFRDGSEDGNPFFLANQLML